LTFLRVIGGHDQTTGDKLWSYDVMGQLVSTNGTELPLNLAEDVANTIRVELVKAGCVIRSRVHMSPTTGTVNAPSIDLAQVAYSYNGTEGRLDVTVVGGHQTRAIDPTGKVLGLLTLTFHEAR
jgi:hypothetical protein